MSPVSLRSAKYHSQILADTTSLYEWNNSVYQGYLLSPAGPLLGLAKVAAMPKPKRQVPKDLAIARRLHQNLTNALVLWRESNGIPELRSAKLAWRMLFDGCLVALQYVVDHCDTEAVDVVRPLSCNAYTIDELDRLLYNDAANGFHGTDADWPPPGWSSRALTQVYAEARSPSVESSSAERHQDRISRRETLPDAPAWLTLEISQPFQLKSVDCFAAATLISVVYMIATARSLWDKLEHCTRTSPFALDGRILSLLDGARGLCTLLLHKFTELDHQDLTYIAIALERQSLCRRFGVFVSHRGKTFKSGLLEHLAVLSRNGVFVDFLQDPKGVTNPGFMWFNLCLSRCIAILSSDDYGESSWCRREYEAAVWLADTFSEVSLCEFDSIWQLRSHLKSLGYLDYSPTNDVSYQIIRADFRSPGRAHVFEEVEQICAREFSGREKFPVFGQRMDHGAVGDRNPFHGACWLCILRALESARRRSSKTPTAQSRLDLRVHSFDSSKVEDQALSFWEKTMKDLKDVAYDPIGAGCIRRQCCLQANQNHPLPDFELLKHDGFTTLLRNISGNSQACGVVSQCAEVPVSCFDSESTLQSALNDGSAVAALHGAISVCATAIATSSAHGEQLGWFVGAMTWELLVRLAQEKHLNDNQRVTIDLLRLLKWTERGWPTSDLPSILPGICVRLDLRGARGPAEVQDAVQWMHDLTTKGIACQIIHDLDQNVPNWVVNGLPVAIWPCTAIYSETHARYLGVLSERSPDTDPEANSRVRVEDHDSSFHDTAEELFRRQFVLEHRLEYASGFINSCDGHRVTHHLYVCPVCDYWLESKCYGYNKQFPVYEHNGTLHVTDHECGEFIRVCSCEV